VSTSPAGGHDNGQDMDLPLDEFPRPPQAERPYGHETVSSVADHLTLIAQPTRLQLLDRLELGGELHEQALVDALSTTQQNVSRHLRLLLVAGLVARRQEGRLSWYRLAEPNALYPVHCVADRITGVYVGGRDSESRVLRHSGLADDRFMATPRQERRATPASGGPSAAAEGEEKRASPVPLASPARGIVAVQLRVLGHPVRVQAVEQLAGGGRTVEELSRALGVTSNTASKHLRELYRVGLLWRRQEGNQARYGLHDAAAVRAIIVLARSAEARRRARQPPSDGGPPSAARLYRR